METFHIKKVVFLIANLLFLSPLVPFSSINASVDVVSGAASDTTTIYLNKDGLTLDSLYSVVFDDKVSYEKKKELSDKSRYIKHPKMEAVLKRLLQEAKKTKDADNILNSYIEIVAYYHAFADYENALSYLDSTDEYVGKAKDPENIGFYYFEKGQIGLRINNDLEKAYFYYNNAIPYFEKTNNYPPICGMLNGIAADAYNFEDTAALHKVRDQMASYALRFPDIQEIQYYNVDIANAWYQLRYKQDGLQADLDSALSTGRRRIAILQRNNLENAYLSVFLDFSLFLERYRPEGWQTEVEGYLAKSRAVIEKEKIDTVSFLVIQQLICEGSLLTLTSHFAEAERKLSISEKALQEYDGEAKESMSTDLYYWFTKLYEAKGDYKNALLYNEKMNEMQLALRDGKISNMLARFDIQNKDMEIERQKAELEQRRKNNWILGLSLAAAVILCFTWGYLSYRKAKETKARLLAEKERSNAEKSQLLAEQNQLKAEQEKLKVENELHEERAANAELEKYEILSDFHLKELELSGKNDELEKLLTSKKELDKQIADFQEKIKTYEDTEANLNTINAKANVIKVEIKDMIHRHLSKNSKQSEFIKALDLIDSNYISFLVQHSDNALNNRSLSYCICIAVGMNVTEMANAFCTEPNTIYKARFRLKKFFNLTDENTDLDAFLQRQTK